MERLFLSFGLALTLFFTACTSSPESRAPKIQVQSPARQLENSYWKLVELNGQKIAIPPEQRTPYLLFIGHEKTVQGDDGCNRLRGSYQQEGEKLKFSALMTTKMACPNLNIETEFLKALETVRLWEIQNDQLSLKDASGNRIAQFIWMQIPI